MTALIGLEIKSIGIITTRVNEDVVRDMIRVHEGDKYSATTLEDIRGRLSQARLFKKITITAARSASGDGVDINLNLWDGWFLVPFPFFISGGGGASVSLLLVERNYFRRAESVSVFAGGNSDGGFGSVNFQLASYSVAARYSQRDALVWSYADGGFNTIGRFRSSRSEDEPERFGAIASEYHRRIVERGLEIKRPVYKGVTASLGFTSQRNDYGDLARGAFPADFGSANGITAGLTYRLGGRRAVGMFEPGFSFSDFGAIFGFGMADLDERIKPLSSRASQVQIEWGMEQMDRSLGSDFNYTKMVVGVLPAVRFRNRQLLTLRTRFAAALREDMPLSQRIATNRDLGLRGNYAREYRGDRGAGTSLNFSYPFRRTRLGAWTADAFTEGAGVWQSGRSFLKGGWGVGLSYQFWRFPLPLGVIYSHSWDDGDGQINAAIGGRF